MSSPKTPEQNEIVERRNRLVLEAIREMMFGNDVSKTFWREAVNTTMYSMNRVQIIKGMDTKVHASKYNN